MQHGAKAVDIPNAPSKLSGNQKTLANPEIKTLSQTTKKKGSDSSLGNSESEEEFSEEEKEYFDDSTEERFYKQSSMSEDSDSGDDFFIGKVKQTRKKESSSHSSAKEQKPFQNMLPTEDAYEDHWDVRNEKSKPLAEARKLESVFFHSLSGSKSCRR
jgi:hypothetical protein